MTQIAPSILSADFLKLAKEIQEVESGGADLIHVDVMDGHFVPNITIGPLIVEAIKPVTDLPLDVHLMIESPEHYISAFARAGASIISIHQEACPHLHRAIQLIKKEGVFAGVVINPATPISMIREVLSDIDMVLVMSVNPGFGGQSFITNSISKIQQLANLRSELGLYFKIEVDGGINTQTAALCTQAGADILVAGSAVFKQSDRRQAITELLEATKRER